MQRILIIGCPGAGKSTFARAMRDATGIPLYYLDRIWHMPDGTNITRAAFTDALRRLLQQESWILDGNYLNTLPLRLEACDTVFLLDYPPQLCLTGALSRIGKAREDLPWVETAMDPEFRQYILDFPAAQLPRIYDLLELYQEGREIHIFKSRAEAAAYLAALMPRPAGSFTPGC